MNTPPALDKKRSPRARAGPQGGDLEVCLQSEGRTSPSMHDHGLRLNHWISRRRCQKKASVISPRPGSAECFEMLAPIPRVQSDRKERREQSARATSYPDSPTNSKAAGQVSNRQLCLRPPYRADSPHTAPVGLPNRHEKRWLFTVAPTLPFNDVRGRTSPTEKVCGHGRAFLRPCDG